MQGIEVGLIASVDLTEKKKKIIIRLGIQPSH